MSFEGIGKAVGYTAYLLGGSTVVGAVRTVDAGAHCLKHIWYQAKINAALDREQNQFQAEYDAREQARNERLNQAKKGTKQADKELNANKKKLNKATNLTEGANAAWDVGLSYLKKKKNSGKEQAIKVRNVIQEEFDDLTQDIQKAINILGRGIIELKEKPLRDEWLVQLVRGIIELIPIIGGIVGIIIDFNHKASELEINPGFLEIERVSQLHSIEKKVDHAVQAFFPEYNPIFH